MPARAAGHPQARRRWAVGSPHRRRPAFRPTLPAGPRRGSGGLTRAEAARRPRGRSWSRWVACQPSTGWSRLPRWPPSVTRRLGCGCGAFGRGSPAATAGAA